MKEWTQRSCLRSWECSVFCSDALRAARRRLSGTRRTGGEKSDQPTKRRLQTRGAQRTPIAVLIAEVITYLLRWVSSGGSIALYSPCYDHLYYSLFIIHYSLLWIISKLIHLLTFLPQRTTCILSTQHYTLFYILLLDLFMLDFILICSFNLKYKYKYYLYFIS